MGVESESKASTYHEVWLKTVPLLQEYYWTWLSRWLSWTPISISMTEIHSSSWSFCLLSHISMSKSCLLPLLPNRHVQSLAPSYCFRFDAQCWAAIPLTRIYEELSWGWSILDLPTIPLKPNLEWAATQILSGALSLHSRHRIVPVSVSTPTPPPCHMYARQSLYPLRYIPTYWCLLNTTHSFLSQDICVFWISPYIS